MRILVVDDDFVTRTKIETLLSVHGQCDTAEDGDQAWEMFQKAHKVFKPYNLITMDVDMPGMNGHEVVKKIREFEEENIHHYESDEVGNEAKIIMVTSMQSRSDVIASFRGGCECFIRKPIKKEDLNEALDKLEILKKV
jgi:two-component system chemotaxis response regulator CheY